MKLYETGKDRAYGNLIMPEAKKYMPRLLKTCNSYLRQNWDSKEDKSWNSFSYMLSNDADVILVLDSNERYQYTQFELFCPLYNGMYENSSYQRTYHTYNHQGLGMGKWDMMIPMIGIAKNLKVKIGWLYGIGV